MIMLENMFRGDDGISRMHINQEWLIMQRSVLQGKRHVPFLVTPDDRLISAHICGAQWDRCDIDNIHQEGQVICKTDVSTAIDKRGSLGLWFYFGVEAQW